MSMKRLIRHLLLTEVLGFWVGTAVGIGVGFAVTGDFVGVFKQYGSEQCLCARKKIEYDLINNLPM